MVADYYTKTSGGTEESTGESAHITLTDLDEDFKLALGETKQILVQILDKNGEPITPLQYRLEYDFDGAASIVDETDGMIAIRASENSVFVGKQIKIKAISEEFESEAVIAIQIVNW